MFTEFKRKIDVQKHEFGWVRFEYQAKFLSSSYTLYHRKQVILFNYKFL